MKKRSLFLIPLVIAVVLIIVGSFLDLQINQTIFASKNGFSIFVASIGEYPTYAFLVLLGAMLISSSIKIIKTKWIKIGAIISGIICCVGFILAEGGVFVSVNGWGAYCPQLNNFGFKILFGVVLIAPFIVFGYILGKKVTDPKICLLLFVLIICVVTTFAIFNLVKVFMARPRYRVIVEIGDISLYRNFWEPFDQYQKYLDLGYISEEFKSFPSGHTSTSTCLCIICFIPYIFNLDKKKCYWLFLIGIAWACIVGFSRMLCGAHFATDVGFGMLLGTIVCFIANEIALRKVLI